MNNWKTRSKNLGEIKANVKVYVFFDYLGDKEVANITASCGCTKPKYLKKKKQVKVAFTPNSIPMHLQSQNKYPAWKSMTVYFTDDTYDVLNIEATIIR